MEALNKIDPAIVGILKRYFAEQPVLKAWVFGSLSRGTASSKSDIDILVCFDESVGLFKYAAMVNDLECLLNREVDLVSESSLLSWVAPSVENDKILVYERETAHETYPCTWLLSRGFKNRMEDNCI